VLRCQSCHKEITLPEPFAPTAVCESCGSALHTCLNCHHYSPEARGQCLISGIAVIEKKREANACPQFHCRNFISQKVQSRYEDARRNFDDLFKSL
jgi:hypothetical protein